MRLWTQPAVVDNPLGKTLDQFGNVPMAPRVHRATVGSTDTARHVIHTRFEPSFLE